MSNKINKIAQAIFIYLEDIGPCEVSVHCYDEEIEQVGSFQPTVWFDGQTHNRNDKKVPMVGTFRNFFMEYTEDHMGELTNRLDYDVNDYHELVFRIYPEEKKIDIKSYCYFIEYSPFEYKYEETPEHIVEMMDEDNVSWFKVEFWGGHDDYSFDYSNMEGDADPGFVRQFEDYFVKYLDKKISKSWSQDQGSEGEFHVNRNTIDLELKLKDEEFRSSGFHKEIKL
jgi:hypothetical protein